jgi:pimeloyl-ACP methyl ester carboxylesterase
VTVRETGFVDVENGRLWYEVAGDGPGVVLLHPGLWDARAWDAQFDVFARRFRVLRYDARGYGRSSRLQPGEPYSNVRDLKAVIDAVGLRRAALVGNSIGGGIAVDAALTHPDRADALVLVSSALGGLEPTPDEDAWFEDRMKGIEAAIEAGDMEAARRIQMNVWAPLGIDDPTGRAIFELAMENIHELTMDESGAEELDPPAKDRLGEVRVPTLIIPADHDPPFVLRAAAALATGIRDARVVDIAHVDHVIPMRAPDAFNEVVLEFLDEVTPSSQAP